MTVGPAMRRGIEGESVRSGLRRSNELRHLRHELFAGHLPGMIEGDVASAIDEHERRRGVHAVAECVLVAHWDGHVVDHPVILPPHLLDVRPLLCRWRSMARE